MSVKIQKFVKSSKKLLSQTGALESRAEFKKLESIAIGLPSVESFLNQLPAKLLIILTLFQTDPGSNDRIRILKEIFSNCLNFSPNPETVSAIKLVPVKDLEKSLLPFFYENSNRGKAACFLAAKSNLILSPEAIKYFLSSRYWSKTDLINLSFLAQNGPAVSAELEKAINSEDSSAESIELFNEFRFLLLDPPSAEPLIPDITQAEPEINIKQDIKCDTATSIETDSSQKQINQNSSHRISSLSISDKLPRKSKKQQLKEEKKAEAETIFSAWHLLGIVGIFSLVAVFLTWHSYSELDADLKERHNSTRKIPDYWTDAINNQKITPGYLTADKDYRMGELFLTRNRYSEAISLFEDAISADPNHVHAHYRLGFCRMRIKDYNGAIKAFKNTLKNDAKYKHANLNLARIYLEIKEPEHAINFYQNEINLYQEPAVAIEFAQCLNHLGKQNQASELIEKFQKLYPERMFVLFADSETPTEN
jgi:TolA-binding protein